LIRARLIAPNNSIGGRSPTPSTDPQEIASGSYPADHPLQISKMFEIHQAWLHINLSIRADDFPRYRIVNLHIQAAFSTFAVSKTV
jgi:hypothetical protein